MSDPILPSILHRLKLITVHGCLIDCPGGPHTEDCETLRNELAQVKRLTAERAAPGCDVCCHDVGVLPTGPTGLCPKHAAELRSAWIGLRTALAAKDDALTTLETQLTYALKGYGPQISLQAMIDLARTALGATQEPQYLPIGHDPSHQHCDCGADECNCYDLPEPPREDCPVHGLGATQKPDVKDWVTGWRPRAGRGGATQKEEIKTPEAGNG